ncbi:TPA: ANR family transcriptional regulator [Klebsiella oxytoca]|uniref:ANR family transcriptional regulator n=1 Tax=Klebsiella oxytoca TaxID=571 RepID=A0AAN5RG02_KLEOX|nr:ANR family transcriptional regulator [Klebsiella oxytoca]
MQRLSLILMRKDAARRAAQAERSLDYATARALWHQVYASSGENEETRWAEARMLFCERQLQHQQALSSPGSVPAGREGVVTVDPEK